MQKSLAAGAAALIAAPLALVMVLTMAGTDDTSNFAMGPGNLNAGKVPPEYAKFVQDAGTRCPQIPASLIAAQIEAESNWNPAATSAAGAQGIAQFIPDTWAKVGKDYSGDGKADVLNPADAIGTQADYMCQLAAQIDGWLKTGAVTGNPTELTLAAYNAGPGAVQANHGIPPFAETQRYVQKIMALKATYEAPQVGPGGQAPGAGGNALAVLLATNRIPPGFTAPGPGTATAGLPPEMAAAAQKAATYSNGTIPESTMCAIPPHWLLRCDAAFRFAQMNQAYRAQFGTDIPLVDTYRDYARQVATKQVSGPMAAEPGTSNHGWGLAVDFGAPAGQGGTAEQAWLATNGPQFGWWWPNWMRVGHPDFQLNEPWHFEFAEGMVVTK